VALADKHSLIRLISIAAKGSQLCITCTVHQLLPKIIPKFLCPPRIRRA
jgi:hypothetical protein